MSSPFWDSVAQDKEFSHPLDLARLSALITPQARILDYGCGYGRLSRQLFDAGYRNVHGVDPSPRMIERAKAENPTLQFDVLPLECGGLPPLFDAVLLFSVLTCIPEDEAQRKLVAEIHNFLRPGGIIYVSDILLQDDARNRERYEKFREVFDRYGVFELEPGVVFRHLERRWIDDLLSPFDPIEFIELDVLTMNRHPARAFQYLGRRR